MKVLFQKLWLTPWTKEPHYAMAPQLIQWRHPIAVFFGWWNGKRFGPLWQAQKYQKERFRDPYY